MYWFWYFMYATMPALLLAGLFGVFGPEAKRAADDFAQAIGTAFVILLVVGALGGLVYLVLKLFGVVS